MTKILVQTKNRALTNKQEQKKSALPNQHIGRRIFFCIRYFRNPAFIGNRDLIRPPGNQAKPFFFKGIHYSSGQ